MWNLFKSKQNEPTDEAREGYKIVPYKDEGFIVEYHCKHPFKPTAKDRIGLIRYVSNFTPYIEYKIFKTKQEAKDLINDIIKEDNERYQRQREVMERHQEFARNNPPEWYP